MTLQELRATRREEILEIAAKRGAHNVRVFGSVARGENDLKSDIDFLVDLAPGRSLLDLCALQRELEHLLATPDLYRDSERVKGTMRAFEETKTRLQQLYEHWEEAVELN